MDTEDEQEFLEAIRRTQREMTPPFDVDVGTIAAEAFADYLEPDKDSGPNRSN